MEKSRFEQQDEFAASEGSVTQNLIRVYRSMGGGWEIENDPSVENRSKEGK
jgi:outer membrane protein TolC